MRTEQERSFEGGEGGGDAFADWILLRQEVVAMKASCAQGFASPLRAKREEVMDANFVLLICYPNASQLVPNRLRAVQIRVARGGAVPRLRAVQRPSDARVHRK